MSPLTNNTGSSRAPFVASILIHGIFFAALFGLFSHQKEGEIFNFEPLKIISSREFQDLVSRQKISEKQKSNQTNIVKSSINKGVGDKKDLSEKTEFSQNNDSSSYNSYVNLIASELEKRKSRFSMAAAPDGVKTVVIFKIKLNQSGYLTSFSFAKNAQYSFFDKIAEKILTASMHFPAPPQDGLEFSVPIVFET
jgi:outer membrane biosynthesis protein TonB